MAFFRFLLIALFLATSCSSGPRRTPQRRLEFSTNAPNRAVRGTTDKKTTPGSSGAARTPDRSLVDISRSWGRVATVNEKLRFVVLEFSIARLPMVDQQMTVYRDGQKVGVVKISGPSFDKNIAADIVSGTAQVGDQVR